MMCFMNHEVNGIRESPGETPVIVVFIANRLRVRLATLM
jgi:hypothetical protein